MLSGVLGCLSENRTGIVANASGNQDQNLPYCSLLGWRLMGSKKIPLTAGLLSTSLKTALIGICLQFLEDSGSNWMATALNIEVCSIIGLVIFSIVCMAISRVSIEKVWQCMTENLCGWNEGHIPPGQLGGPVANAGFIFWAVSLTAGQV
jgi:hypothetical protein